ncbi:flavin-containing monooxygenase [Sandaracinus amylolyticus]|uniref:flavin-containing monooxygenase n=1 Tax=Sandaracinus amylolyticus TaxID=927083 RepID=UPI001F44BA1F|nr:NAD(P)-binding domain-containing protein [Sandaracinus amylolyticus]UJR79413.1 putative flavoprotein CzcO associated with the cation diffusion facilitator CzcD [Sandaracinus amylolyticus]
MSLPRTCIIGAGSSGIATAKVLHQRGLPFDCYEKSDRVGGNWVHRNKNGMSACYRGLYINTSRGRMAYSDFPMPAEYPDFPHHSQIAAYFERYVDHFGFRRAIRFETGVERAVRRADGRFDVTLSSGETKTYDALAVANGHHWDPRWPEPAFPGHFDGVQMHAHEYDEPDAWKDANVLVLGMGNSAMDIAVEASYVAKKTFLASRRGAWIVPKHMFGRPLDTIITDPRVPFRIRRRIGETLLALTAGSPTNYGLPMPDHRFGSAHPTISGRILDRLSHGAIEYRPNIERLEGKQVRFVDGRVEDVDVIVYCTGYKVTFPFFDPSFVSAPDNDLPLFRRVFHPAYPNLFFVGLLQPLGAIMPLAEAQSEWIAEYLQGEYALPSRREMEGDVARERDTMFDRYVASPRHTMQVDFDDYLMDLDAERARGRRRARDVRFAKVR